MASRMIRRASSAFLLVALASIVSILAANLATNPAYAQASGSAEGTLWGSMLKGLGIGGENNIEYRERPPLVVPQTRDLPPPQPAGTARNDPNWPADPKSAGTAKKGAQVRDLNRMPVEVGAAPTVAPSQPAKSDSLFGNLFSSKDTGVPPTPTRRALTDPPLDFQTPSPSQPYGDAPKAAPAKPASGESALASAPGTPPGANPSASPPPQ